MMRTIVRVVMVLAAVTVAVSFVPSAMAQGAAPQAKYKRETNYDFDDDVVEGELQRPDGEIIDTRRQARHSSLIKVREHFIPEILKSAENI